jgi:hypothetical protein
MGGRHKRLGLTGPAGLLLVAGWLEVLVSNLCAQVPPGWELVQITDDSDYDARPSLNNCRQVVFSKRINNSIPDEEIFLWDGGQLTRLTDDGVNDFIPNINDQGTITWSRAVGVNASWEIAIRHAGETTVLTDNALDDFAPRLNELDHLVWDRTTGGQCGESDIYYYDGARTLQLTVENMSNQGATLNDADQIAWTKYDFCVSPWLSTIMLHSGGKTLPMTSGLQGDQAPQINNRLEIVWDGPGQPGHHGVWLQNSETLIQVTDDGTVPRINNRGTIMFNRWYGGMEFQIWTYLDGAFTQMTAFPGWKFGKAINDHGDIALEVGQFPTTDIFLLRSLRHIPDVDADGDTDLGDLATMQRCFHLHECALGAVCSFSDLNVDQFVDLGDFADFLVQFNGPN